MSWAIQAWAIGAICGALIYAFLVQAARESVKLGIRVHFKFIWFDMWVGLFWDAEKRLLYVAPLPCCIFIIGPL